MAVWWQSLSTLEHVLLYIAVPATLILILQTVLLFAGGSLDSDGDAGEPDAPDGELDLPDGELDVPDGELDLPDGELDVPDGELDLPDGAFHWESGDDGSHLPAHGGDGPYGSLHLVTLRGVVAFLVLFGWGGLWLSQMGLPGFLAVFLAIPMGFAGMVGTALLVRQALRLQYDGTLDLRNALGQVGAVYLTVPPRRTGPGKVTVTVQEQLRELDALTDAPDPIPTGAAVRVTGLAGRDTLLVEPEPSTHDK